MTYVIIDGRGLSGLGTVSTSEGAARAQLERLFLDTTSKWVRVLDEAIANTPTFPLWEMNGAKSNLKAARDQIFSRVNPTGSEVIRDATIPLPEVQRRVADFLTSYFDGIKGQMDIAKAATQRATLEGQLKIFRENTVRVVRAVVREAAGIIAEGVDEATKTSPWVFALGGLAVVALAAYSWRAFR